MAKIILPFFCYWLVIFILIIQLHIKLSILVLPKWIRSCSDVCMRQWICQFCICKQLFAIFLDNKTSSFECKNLAPVHATALNYFQSLERYMILSAGILWKILGVDWNHVIPLFLILYSMSLLATYSIFRLGMNPFLSFFSLFIAFSFYKCTMWPSSEITLWLLFAWCRLDFGKLVLTLLIENNYFNSLFCLAYI